MRGTSARAVLGCAMVCVCLWAPPAQANIFTSILREAGEAGGKAAGHAGSHAGSHLGAVGKAATHLKGLSGAPKGALAAHATPEGHWQFVNREGQTFTAGTADEMKRAFPTLAPEAAAGQSKMTLFLSEDSVFQNRAALDQLPKDASLHVVSDSGSYAITRTGTGSATVLKVRLKPNLTIDLADRTLFDETVSYLGRSLSKSNIRTIALEPGAGGRLSSAPKFDAASKLPLVDTLDPANLSSAFGAIRGQTALVTGRVENGKLLFSPSKGGEFSCDIDELVRAANHNDVNLVILHTDATRQPGGRNWLWQTVEIGGLKDASKSATFGDFLDALAVKRGGFQLSAAQEGTGRVQLSAKPSDTGGMTSGAASLFEDTVSHVTGEILTKGAEIHSRDKSSQSEIDARLLPGIPTYIQIPYLIGLVTGILAWGTARRWWQRIWPSAAGDASAERFKRWLSTTPREVAYLLVFLPIAGMPALMWQFAVQTWATVTGPFRWIHRRFLRREV